MTAMVGSEVLHVLDAEVCLRQNNQPSQAAQAGMHGPERGPAQPFAEN